MAIVLEATYSKKLGLPGYSSHQYGVTIRAELTDIKQVPEESARLYQLLQDSVDREIQHPGWLPEQGETNGHTNGHAANGNVTRWNCSPKQKDLILKIVDEHHVDKNDIEALANERFDKTVTALSRLEASGLIDELLETYGGKRSNGNGRGNGRAAFTGGRR